MIFSSIGIAFIGVAVFLFASRRRRGESPQGAAEKDSARFLTGGVAALPKLGRRIMGMAFLSLPLIVALVSWQLVIHLVADAGALWFWMHSLPTSLAILGAPGYLSTLYAAVNQMPVPRDRPLVPLGLGFALAGNLLGVLLSLSWLKPPLFLPPLASLIICFELAAIQWGKNRQMPPRIRLAWYTTAALTIAYLVWITGWGFA